MITEGDILDVAKSINVELTKDELNWVKLCYEDAQRQDPSGTWNLVVEDLIYQAVEFRKSGISEYADFHHPSHGEDASTDDCWFDHEDDEPPIGMGGLIV